MGKMARGNKATEGKAAAMPAKTLPASSPKPARQKMPTEEIGAGLSYPVPGWQKVPVARYVPAGTIAASVAARGERRMTPEEIDAAVARAKAARLEKMGYPPSEPALIREESEPGEEKWEV